MEHMDLALLITIVPVSVLILLSILGYILSNHPIIILIDKVNIELNFLCEEDMRTQGDEIRFLIKQEYDRR